MRGAIRHEAPRDTAVQLLDPTGEAGIFRLILHGVHKHRTRHCELAVANVAVGPMIKEVCLLDRRESRTEVGMKSVGPDPMARDRGHGDLIRPHWRRHSSFAGESAQTRKIVSSARLDQRERTRRPGERPNGAMAGHVDRHEVRPLLQRSYARRVPVVNGVERSKKR